MTEQDKIKRYIFLQNMIQTEGWQVINDEIERRVNELWSQFVDLPPAAKTAEIAYEAHGRHQELLRLKEWIKDEINTGYQAEQFELKRSTTSNASSTNEAGL